MSEKIKLYCWIKGDNLSRVFSVKVEQSASVEELKNVIQAERLSSGDDTFDLWQVERPLPTLDDESANLIKLEGPPLGSSVRISTLWEEQPSEDALSVVLLRPAGTTITTSSSIEYRLSDGSKKYSEDRRPVKRKHLGGEEIYEVPSATTTPFSSQNYPRWLVELHKTFWRRRDLFDQIFRTVNLAVIDFIELQQTLHTLNPSRSSGSYVAQDILTTQADFLRPRSFADQKTAAHFVDYTATSDLVPQLAVDTSEDLTPPDVVEADAADGTDAVGADAADNTDALDVGTVGSDPMDESGVSADPDLSYIFTDAAQLSEGSTAILPCTVRYMDLTSLHLKHLNRVPHLMRIRDEWRIVVDIFNRKKTGIQGSAVFTGQPGIGKTCLLYYILILCMIRGQPIVFQDTTGEVFFINDDVSRITDETLRITGVIDIPSNEVLALVDADGEFCKPNPYLVRFVEVRVLLTSPPSSRTDRRWLTQFAKDSRAVYVMEPWSQKEFVLTSLFLAGIDITLNRFYQTTRICGYIPRECFLAAESPAELLLVTDQILRAIWGTFDLASAVVDGSNGNPLHCALEIFPAPGFRNYELCLTRPVSDWALSQLIARLDLGVNSAYDFYWRIRGTRNSAAFIGKMFESKVHQFFQSIAEPRHFTIYALDDPSITFQLTFSFHTPHKTFDSTEHFANNLASSVNAGQSIYLKPLSPVFPTLDSFLYQYDVSQSGCQPLIALQMTTTEDHPISSKALADVQTSLEPQIPALKATVDARWIVLFVVPARMAASFVTQRVASARDATTWSQKTTQYVLELSEEEVMRS